MQALSLTPFAAGLLEGPLTRGVSLGHGHLLFPDGVLSLTRPGRLRMPNGLECELHDPLPGASVHVGAGRLECGFGTVRPGPLWGPTPRPRFAVSTSPALESWPLLSLAGQGPGLTPLGDDVATGYLAALALFGGHQPLALAESLATRTTSLSATLLRLAAYGQLPEAAHRLLERGDPEPLLAWGATSGSGILAGLGLLPGGQVAADTRLEENDAIWRGSRGQARRPAPTGNSPAVRMLELTLPLDPPRLVHVEIRGISGLCADAGDGVERHGELCCQRGS